MLVFSLLSDPAEAGRYPNHSVRHATCPPSGRAGHAPIVVGSLITSVLAIAAVAARGRTSEESLPETARQRWQHRRATGRGQVANRMVLQRASSKFLAGSCP